MQIEVFADGVHLEELISVPPWTELVGRWNFTTNVTTIDVAVTPGPADSDTNDIVVLVTVVDFEEGKSSVGGERNRDGRSVKRRKRKGGE